MYSSKVFPEIKVEVSTSVFKNHQILKPFHKNYSNESNSFFLEDILVIFAPSNSGTSLVNACAKFFRSLKVPFIIGKKF